MQTPGIPAGTMKQTFYGGAWEDILNKPVGESYHQSVENWSKSKLVLCTNWLNIPKGSSLSPTLIRLGVWTVVWLYYNIIFINWPIYHLFIWDSFELETLYKHPHLPLFALLLECLLSRELRRNSLLGKICAIDWMFVPLENLYVET